MNQSLFKMHNRSAWSLVVATIVGIAAFLYPFVLPGIQQVTDDSTAHAGAAPLLFAAVVCVVLVVTLASLADDAVGVERSRTVALLGVLVAIDATLRLVPSVAGASPVFLLIMLVGAVFGPVIGFQMGALTLLLSAFITGGIGPWLPFQILASGWVGMTAGMLPRHDSIRRRVIDLAIFGAVWGLLFGALMNLWFWPFTAPGVDADFALYWQPDLSLQETIQRYGRFYLVTSLGLMPSGLSVMCCLCCFSADQFEAAGSVSNEIPMATMGGRLVHAGAARLAGGIEARQQIMPGGILQRLFAGLGFVLT